MIQSKGTWVNMAGAEDPYGFGFVWFHCNQPHIIPCHLVCRMWTPAHTGLRSAVRVLLWVVPGPAKLALTGRSDTGRLESDIVKSSQPPTVRRRKLTPNVSLPSTVLEDGNLEGVVRLLGKWVVVNWCRIFVFAICGAQHFDNIQSTTIGRFKTGFTWKGLLVTWIPLCVKYSIKQSCLTANQLLTRPWIICTTRNWASYWNELLKWVIFSNGNLYWSSSSCTVSAHPRSQWYDSDAS